MAIDESESADVLMWMTSRPWTGQKWFVLALAVSPLTLGELFGCLGRCANGVAKNTVVCFRKWRTYTKKRGMNMIKVNETHVQVVLWEDIGTALFQVCCRRVNLFPNNFHFTYTRQAMSQFSLTMLLLVLWRYWRHWIQIWSPISCCENTALPLSAPVQLATVG